MKKSFLISVVVCVILTACGGQKNIPTVFPSITPEPSSTKTPTVTSTPTLTSTPTRIQPTELPPTPTFTPFPPYQNKQIVFDYYMVGNLSDDNMFFDPYPTTTRLVLYDDGQMIIAGKEPYKQKVLSSGEINRFLSKLETLGFYSLESNQKHDPTDKLYDYGNDYQESFDGVKDCILVNADRSRNLCVYEPDQQFLIPEMKNILKYLEEYKPVGMTPYYPDRIFLSIRAADPSSDTLPANAIPWDKHFPSLETAKPRVYTSDTLNAIVYVDGDMAKKIYMFFLSSDGSGVFTQNGKEYIVYMDVILPHEKITNNHQ